MTNKHEIHVEAIRHALNTSGLDTADFLNKMALEYKMIDVEDYLAAARILAEVIIAR